MENESPADALLQVFRKNLADMYEFYDPISANCITTCAMDFINGCLLEQESTIRNMKLSDAAHSWPYYLRMKTGTAVAYAFMLFPKKSHPDMSVYIQAIDDMCLFINLANDILSYASSSPYPMDS